MICQLAEIRKSLGLKCRRQVAEPESLSFCKYRQGNDFRVLGSLTLGAPGITIKGVVSIGQICAERSAVSARNAGGPQSGVRALVSWSDH